ncbi:MAG: ATP-binding protein [Gemmataceae bacterium]
MLDTKETYRLMFPNSSNSSEARVVTIPSATADASRVRNELEQLLKQHEFDEKAIFGIQLALEEAFINAIKHGNNNDPDKKVHITYRVTRERFDIHIRDEGPGFDPNDVPDPLAPENLERDCGRGLLLMRHYMTQVEHHEPGNAVSMSKVKD